MPKESPASVVGVRLARSPVEAAGFILPCSSATCLLLDLCVSANLYYFIACCVVVFLLLLKQATLLIDFILLLRDLTQTQEVIVF